jgi:hypothetical protein
MDDAKAAGLLGKQGPWSQYPKRMRQMRARGFALRDVFPDVLKGMPVAEEVMDTPAERHMGMVEEVKSAEPAKPALPPYSDDDFAKNLPAWTKAVEIGKKTAPDLLAMLSTRATFSEEQKARILSLKKDAPTPAPAADDPFVAEMNAAEEGAK